MSRRLFADGHERRDRVQLYADIIKVSNQETKITRILRLANIQYNTFHESIETLCSSDLLERVELEKKPHKYTDTRTKVMYKATEMGLKWVEIVDEIYKSLEKPVPNF